MKINWNFSVLCSALTELSQGLAALSEQVMGLGWCNADFLGQTPAEYKTELYVLSLGLIKWYFQPHLDEVNP